MEIKPMMKKVYIAALCLVATQAFGKYQKVVERPYAEKNFTTLANRLPNRMWLMNTEPFQGRTFIFFKNRKKHLTALSVEQKKQYYALLQDLYAARGEAYFAAEEKVADFAQTNGLGTIHTFYFHGPAVRMEKTLVELTGTAFEKQFAKLSEQEKAQYSELKTAADAAHRDEKKDDSYKNHRRAVLADMEFENFQIQVGLAYFNVTEGW